MRQTSGHGLGSQGARSQASPYGGADSASDRRIPDVHTVRMRRECRAVLLLAIILEIQSPRLEGNYRLNIAAFGFLAVLLLLTRARQASAHFYVALSGAMAFLTAYSSWCLATVIWSANPVDTLVDSLILILVVCIAISYSYIPVWLFAQEFVKAAVLLALISWVMAVVLPGVAVLPDSVWRLNGPMQHSQRLALVMGAALVMLAVLHLFHQREYGLPSTRAYWSFAILAATLLATQTRAFTIFTALVVWFVVFAKAKARQRVVLLMGMIIAAYIAFANYDQLLATIDRDGSNTDTLTGRTVIWEQAILLIRENPYLGYGFSSFYSDLTRNFFESGYMAPHAHNTWINSTFETGLVGAILLTLFMIGVLRYGSFFNPTIAFALMLLTALCGSTGIVFGGKISTLWVCVAVVAAQTTFQRARRPDRSPRLSRPPNS